MSKIELAEKRSSEFDKAEAFIDLQSMEIGDIIFDYNKALIRLEDMARLDQIVALMKTQQNTKLMIRAHCDSRGSLAYNQSLSMSRAMAVQGYLIQKGIKRDRMVAEWFGEQKPLNGCIDNVPCEESEFEINRRAEFKLIEY
jgi:peptidoglycan-associated lipoprotein